MNTKQELVNRLNQANQDEIKANRIHKAVANWMKIEDGNRLDGWCEKRAKKHFAALGWNVRFYTVCGDQNYLLVSGGDSGYSDREPIRMFLGYGKDMGSLSVEVFEDRNCSYGQAAEYRIATRVALTASENDLWLSQAATAIDSFKIAKTTLETFMGDSNEAFYHIRDLAGYVDKR